MTTPQQEVNRELELDPDESSSPTMNPPVRRPPNLPPYEEFQTVQRPAPHQYGITSGMRPTNRTSPSSQTYPSPVLPSAPPRPPKVPTHPYQSGPGQAARQESYQPLQKTPHNGLRQPQPPTYREQSNYDPRLVQQGQQRRRSENTDTSRPADHDLRLLAQYQTQQRGVSENVEPNRLANHDPRSTTYQEGQINQAAAPLEPRRFTNHSLRLDLHQPVYQSRVSEAPDPSRPANFDPRLVQPQRDSDVDMVRRTNYDSRQVSYGEGQPRRVSENMELTQRANYNSKQLHQPEERPDRSAEDNRTSRPAYRNISAPHPPHSTFQGTPNYPPTPAASVAGQPQATGLPSPISEIQQTSYVAQQPGRPPIPQAHRSTSQPPELRNTRRTSPQAKKPNKPSQSQLPGSQLPQSPEPSPRASPVLHSRGRSESLAAIPTFDDVNAMNDASNRPDSYHSDAGSSDGKGNRRKSWLPGRSRRSSQDMAAIMNGPGAWVVGGTEKVTYNVEPLLNAKKVPELWDDTANTFVYLFPEESRQGPSFRVPSAIISSSPKLRVLAFGHSQKSLRRRARSFDGRSTLSALDATRYVNVRKPATPPYTPTVGPQDNQTSSSGSVESMSSSGETTRESHLYFPSGIKNTSQNPQQFSQEEHDHLVSVRNFFAFLIGRPLVATKSTPSVFSVFCVIANYLKELEFSNLDGSTYGETVSTSLNYYIENLDLKTVATSREKTLEGIVMGERLRSMELYNEAFTHAVGKYEAVHDMKSPIWDLITPNTRNRLERAFMDLSQRQHSVQIRLADFEFPSLFAGFAASTSSAASKVVRFKAWRSSFSTLRRHILSYYKDLYGDWPPRAKSKKNSFSISGLNRLVLRTLHNDLCTIYDLLVDRESLTTRSIDVHSAIPEGDTESELMISALRTVESEYDHSSPPVQPPIPFDIPKIPTIMTIDPRINEHTPKVRQQTETRKLHSHEFRLILARSHNLDSDIPSPFLKAFCLLEEKEAKGRSAQDLADQRFGYWLFIYVVLQALPMVTIDAPGLQNADGVQYFLCQPPKGGAPWTEDAAVARRAWYGVTGSSGVVALPSDVVDHGVEAIYRRSHCWIAADKWLEAGHCPPTIDQGQQEPNFDDNDMAAGYRRPEIRTDLLGDTSGRYHDGLMDRQGRPLSVVAESIAASPGSQRGTLSPLTQHPGSRPRARSASNNRRSIAFGLEQLPVPPGYNMSPHGSPHLSPILNSQASPPTGSDQGGLGYGLGIVASNGQPSSQSGGASATESATQVKNFDQILNSLQQEKGKKDKIRRKSLINLLDF